MTSKYTREDMLKLRTEIPAYTNWAEFVRARNPDYLEDGCADTDNDWDTSKMCYFCEQLFRVNDSIPREENFPGYRYKPHKPDWSVEYTCQMCFNATQNPKFIKELNAFANTSQGYPGIMTRDGYEDWNFHDLRVDWGEFDGNEEYSEFQTPRLASPPFTEREFRNGRMDE